MPSGTLWQLALLMDRGFSQWVKVAMGDWHRESGVRGLEVLTFAWMCMTGASAWNGEEEEHCWIKLMKSGKAGSEDGKEEIRSHGGEWPYHTNSHTHTCTLIEDGVHWLWHVWRYLSWCRRQAVCQPWQFWVCSVRHTSSSTVNSAEQMSICFCPLGISNLSKERRVDG